MDCKSEGIRLAVFILTKIFPTMVKKGERGASLVNPNNPYVNP
ncbi:hypothetical protein NEOC95_001907 [Neochlamydia sp. AcF95]|nr:hypothetical protein [Neochlamydia sp. AcF95]